MQHPRAIHPLSVLKSQSLQERTGLSRSAIYDKLNPTSPRHDPEFPKQVKLGPRAVGWIESEVNGWLQQTMSSRVGQNLSRSQQDL